MFRRRHYKDLEAISPETARLAGEVGKAVKRRCYALRRTDNLGGLVVGGAYMLAGPRGAKAAGHWVAEQAMSYPAAHADVHEAITSLMEHLRNNPKDAEALNALHGPMLALGPNGFERTRNVLGRYPRIVVGPVTRAEMRVMEARQRASTAFARVGQRVRLKRIENKPGREVRLLR